MSDNTLDFIFKKYNLKEDASSPINLPLDRNGLAKTFADLKFTIGAEIGVESGVYSEILLETVPDLKLYSIDAWQAYRDYRDHRNQSKLDRFYRETINLLGKFKNSEIIRKFSLDAVKDFKNGYLDFVYIDSNHNFQNVTNDMVEWSKKVKSGGIISGHDYIEGQALPSIHVRQVLQGYAEAFRISPWFVLTDTSWFWINS